MAKTFLPSVHGFHFENSFDIEIASGVGLCGGMVFASIDYFYANIPIPAETVPPEIDTPLFTTLVKRQLNSLALPGGLIKVYKWTRQADIYEDSIKQLELLTHFPAPLMLIRVKTANPFKLVDNHQVLAYALQDNTLSIYDPNYPNDDSITLTWQNGEILHSHEGPIRGFYSNLDAYVPDAVDTA